MYVCIINSRKKGTLRHVDLMSHNKLSWINDVLAIIIKSNKNKNKNNK